MRKVLGRVALVSLIAVTPVAAQEVYIDYDKAFDRSTVKTYAWGTTDATLAQANPRAHAYIIERVDAHLAEHGLKKVDANPDVRVTYHTNSKQELSVNTDAWGYGAPTSFYWDPYWGAPMGTTTTVRSYTRGTLILDIWTEADRKLIWRGSASDIVPDNPEKAYKRIDKALQKMADKWEKAKKKEK